MDLILSTPELKAVESSRAEQIRQIFVPMADMLEQFENVYNIIIEESKGEITKEITKRAKRIRLDIGKIRIETEKVRKAQKEEYLRAGKAIDGVANILKWAISEKEGKLKEIENYFEIKENERLKKLQEERVNLISQYLDDAHERDLASMDDDVWDAYFAAKKKAYEDKVEAEKQAEKERIKREKKAKIHKERKDAVLKYWNLIDDETKFSNFADMTEKEYKFLVSNLKKEFDKQEKERERVLAEKNKIKKEKAKLEREKAKIKKEKENLEKEKTENKNWGSTSQGTNEPKYKLGDKKNTSTINLKGMPTDDLVELYNKVIEELKIREIFVN